LVRNAAKQKKMKKSPRANFTQHTHTHT
jgi:hypothetical protein